MTEFYWIMELGASFIEIFMCSIFCGTFLEQEKLGERKYLVIVGSGIGSILVLFLNRMDIFSFINSMLVILIVFGLQLLIYKTKIGQTVLLTLIYMVILTAVDFMTAYFSGFILGTDAGYLLNTQSLKRVICILLSKTLLALIIVTLSKLLKRTIIFLKRYVVIMCIYSIFLLVSLFIMVELNMDNGNTKTDMFFIIFFIVSIIIELLMFYFVIKTGESYEQQQTAELIEMKNSMLQKSLNETEQTFKLWRSSVHDYKHNIIALTQLANDGNIAEIKKYLEQENELIDRKMFYIRTGSAVVDTIVNTKQSFAEEKGITFVVNAKVPEECIVSELDMANILGNLIDNAIEASISEEEPYIDITIRQDKHFIVIKIINKFSRDFSKGLETTKHKKIFHGIGTSSVKNIVEKYKGEFSIDKQGNEVIAKILIPNFK